MVTKIALLVAALLCTGAAVAAHYYLGAGALIGFSTAGALSLAAFTASCLCSCKNSPHPPATPSASPAPSTPLVVSTPPSSPTPSVTGDDDEIIEETEISKEERLEELIPALTTIAKDEPSFEAFYQGLAASPFSLDDRHWLITHLYRTHVTTLLLGSEKALKKAARAYALKALVTTLENHNFCPRTIRDRSRLYFSLTSFSEIAKYELWLNHCFESIGEGEDLVLRAVVQFTKTKALECTHTMTTESDTLPLSFELKPLKVDRQFDSPEYKAKIRAFVRTELFGIDSLVDFHIDRNLGESDRLISCMESLAKLEGKIGEPIQTKEKLREAILAPEPTKTAREVLQRDAEPEKIHAALLHTLSAFNESALQEWFESFKDVPLSPSRYYACVRPAFNAFKTCLPAHLDDHMEDPVEQIFWNAFITLLRNRGFTRTGEGGSLTLTLKTKECYEEVRNFHDEGNVSVGVVHALKAEVEANPDKKFRIVLRVTDAQEFSIYHWQCVFDQFKGVRQLKALTIHANNNFKPRPIFRGAMQSFLEANPNTKLSIKHGNTQLEIPKEDADN